MQKMLSMRKALGLLLVILLLVCTIYVPVALSVSAIASVEIADDTAVVFDFENVVKSENDNKAEATGEAGIGYFGWGGNVKAYKDEGGNVMNTVLFLGKSDANSWVTKGGYRLHTKLSDDTYGFYQLSPSSKYVVSFKIRVKASPILIEGSKDSNKAEVKLGYNSLYNPNASGQGSNYINDMKTQIPVVTSLIGSETFTLTDNYGKVTEYKYSEEWINVRYFIDTPASFTEDPALAFWATKYYGFDCEIDDVSVVKVGAESGMVILADEYSGVEEVLFGKIGTVVTLPDISDKAHNSDHAFEGWYVNVDRTEKAENLTFGETFQTVYSRWKAPVTITFKDNVNGTEQKIVGSAGDSFVYPADPVDPSNESWFMGWYADEAGTKEHTSGKFGYADATIFAYFKGRIAGIDQGFEDYDKDQYTVKYNANGQAYKSNRLIFGATFSKQSEVTYNNSDYAVKFHWNPVAINDKANEHYYDVTRFNAKDNYFHIGSGLEEGQLYVVTFKYKAEKANAPVNFYMISGVYNNGWGDRADFGGISKLEIKQSDKWQEATFRITPIYKNGANHMYLGVSLTENEETVIYFDDIKVEAFSQPYESAVYAHTNLGDEIVNLKGVRGEEINFPVLTHPDGAEFLGWYTDSALKIPFKSTVYLRGNMELYAKWGAATMTFRTYPFEGHPYADPYINVEHKKDIGNGDDYAMHWKLKRTVTDNSGVGTSRAFVIYKGLEEGAVYRVKFDYKANSNNNKRATLSVVSGDWRSIWWNNVITTYSASTVTLPVGETDGWQTQEVYINADIKSFIDENDNRQISDTFFLRFSAAGITEAGTDMDILVDNVLVEKIEAPYIYFDGQNRKNGAMVRGKAGENIQLPENPERIGYDFAGWYLNTECTVKFTQKTFGADDAITVYAKWNKSSTSVYSFENYTLVDGVKFAVKDGEAVKRNAKKGKYSMYFGNRTPGNYESRSYFAFEDSGEYFRLEEDSQYVITFNYLIKEHGNSGMYLSFIASWADNIWVGLNAGKHSTISVTHPITTNMAKRQKGKWCQMSFAVDTNDLEMGPENIPLDCLYTMITGGENWEIYFDEITITKIPKGKNLVVVHSEGAKGAPTYFIGKTGEDYTAKLPETLVNDDLYFKGYYTNPKNGGYLELTRKEMHFGDRALVVFARFLEYEVNENFDTGYYDKALGGGIGYTIHDFDYEVYDSEKEGNSKDNVTSGRYSLHRKGDSMYKENAVILTLGNQIAEGERYRVSFRVKMGKHLHTDGAIKIVSGRSFEYAWTTTGDYYPVVPIADLTDGQWHEVSYVFNSVEAFVNVQTPGYVELYMDDFKFELVGEDVALSEPSVYAEYVAAKRDENGNLLKKNRADVDVTSIIDESVGKSSLPIIYVIIGVAALLVIVGGVVTIILVSKKKKA